MQIKSIVVGAVFGLIAGVGSVSAEELSLADTAGDPGTPFAMLNGITTEQMLVQAMANVRGAGQAAEAAYIAGLSSSTADNGVVYQFDTDVNLTPDGNFGFSTALAMETVTILFMSFSFVAVLAAMASALATAGDTGHRPSLPTSRKSPRRRCHPLNWRRPGALGGGIADGCHATMTD